MFVVVLLWCFRRVCLHDHVVFFHFLFAVRFSLFRATIVRPWLHWACQCASYGRPRVVISFVFHGVERLQPHRRVQSPCSFSHMRRILWCTTWPGLVASTSNRIENGLLEGLLSMVSQSSIAPIESFQCDSRGLRCDTDLCDCACLFPCASRFLDLLEECIVFDGVRWQGLHVRGECLCVFRPVLPENLVHTGVRGSHTFVNICCNFVVVLASILSPRPPNRFPVSFRDLTQHSLCYICAALVRPDMFLCFM
jgi:hypothetical protein